ncbi:Dynein regulatory complex protein 11 [Saguinus oedipus]|uniref:Dynein regulatory complex protein 11 n=1 Tax=Saguinus oedipus TaxID=9490 RepID=A0ABQ9VFQ1_SAGOE|nr:Dynein regulatory complex protein 11 [Saguinus oedipus]
MARSDSHRLEVILPGVLNSQPNEPKRLKKHLPKILKLLKPEDRILIVGTTQRPFDAELQSFCKVYQKIILVPRPDYASRYGKYPNPSRVHGT